MAMKKFSIIFFTFVIILSLAACTVEAESVELSTTEVFLEIGESLQIEAEVIPPEAEFDEYE